MSEQDLDRGTADSGNPAGLDQFLVGPGCWRQRKLKHPVSLYHFTPELHAGPQTWPDPAGFKDSGGGSPRKTMVC